MRLFIRHSIHVYITALTVLLLVCNAMNTLAQTCSGTWGNPIINQTFGQGQGGGQFFGPLSTYAPGATTSTNFIYSQIADNYSCLTPNAGNGQSGGTWVNVKDHTGDANGLMFLINAPSTAATVFFEYTMNNLCPNTVLQFSVWILNVNDPSLTSNPNYQYPNMQINLVDANTGTAIATTSTGDVPADRGWHNYTLTFNNTTSTNVKMQLVNYSVGSGYGNDLALDDIVVRPCVPIVRIAPKLDTVVCLGNSFSFTANVTGNVYTAPEYNWQYSADRGSTWQSIKAPGAGQTNCAFSPNDTGTYWVRYQVGPAGFSSNSNCAAVSDTSIIRVAGFPAPPSLRDDTLCPGQAVSFESGTNMLWYTAPAGGTGTVLPPSIVTSVSGVDTVYATETSVYGCESDRSSKIITVKQGVDVVPMTDTSVCRGNSVQLNASGATYYLWIPSAGLSCADCANPVATPAQTTKYTVIGSNDLYCFDTTSITVRVDEPVASFQMAKHNICQGDTLAITNTSQGSNLSYTWYSGDSVVTAAKDPVYSYNIPGAYKISLLVENGNCRDSVTDSIVVDTMGTFIRFTTDTNGICAGNAITFFSEYGPGTADVIWTYGDNTDSIHSWSYRQLYEQSGSIIVTVIGKYRSCPDLSFSDTVTIYPYPIVNVGPDTAICPNGAPIQVANLHTGDAAYTYHWSTGDATSATSITQPGTYYLTAVVNGCTTTDTVLVRRDCFLDIPNAFSPNNDGINDFFFPRQLLSGSVGGFHIQVYDRWGQMVFESNSNNGRGWDGMYNNKPQPEGVYVYLIEATLGSMGHEKYQGNVTLIR